MLKLCHHVTLAGLLVLAFLTACGSENPGTEGFAGTGPSIFSSSVAGIHIVESSAPRLTMVRPIPNLVQLTPGETVALSSLAFDQNGNEITDASFLWQMADLRAGTVSTRGVFRAGLVSGFFDQAIFVTARVSSPDGPVSIQGTASVSIGDLGGDLNATGVVVIPGTIESFPGEVRSLIAMAIDVNRITIPLEEFRWEMVEPLAGFISQDGEFTASQNPGEYPGALQVELASSSTSGKPIQTLVDVLVLEPGQALSRISVTVLPQFVSVIPSETFRFTAIVLDQQGNRLPTENLQWEILDSAAGSISQDGLFESGNVVGTYPDVVKVTLTSPNLGGELTASGTVSILDSDVIGTGLPQPSTFTIFPDRLVLAPGETSRVSIIGLSPNEISRSSDSVQWSLDPPQVAEISQDTQFINITAGNLPGVYQNAIKVSISLDGDSGPVSHELSSTLVVRGPLVSVKITPKIATLEPGARVLFRAMSYDQHGISLPDVSLRWAVLDPAAGSINLEGLFTAGQNPGEYPGAVEVTAAQRQPQPS